ncbi:MAG: glycosyltransferase family 39 protein [Candidatus Moranbacteria bacterium]|nr:glycosyltransferase family 39 protein [Candidatus Moranbacteria bacterium]
MKNKTIIILIAICCVGIFLRTYNFSNNIFFEIDQARDYRIIDKVLTNGIGEFPLVGPKAGGTFFRLGSLFYLPALISSKIFGLSVFSMVLPELIFSILTIPAFYFLLKEFFSKRISLYLIALFSVSLFVVEYTYFSWNPNSIPFFLVLSFYSLLRYSRAENKKIKIIKSHNFLFLKIKNLLKNLDNKTFWIIPFAFSTAWAMQLHTVALIGLPIILFLYFIITRVKISLKHFAIFGSVSIFLFFPLICNDILTKGENTQEFLKATIRRNASDEQATMPKKSFMNVYNFTRFYTNILVSKNFISDPIRVESSDGLNDLMTKNFSNSVLQNNIFKAILIFIFLMISFYFFARNYFSKLKDNFSKINIQKNRFVLLMLIWQVVYLFLFYPLSLDVDSRYFLVVLFVPFILLGFAIILFEKYFPKYGKKIIFVGMLFLIILNFWQSFSWLKMIDNDDKKDVEINEFILEPYYLVTNKQWKKITDVIENRFDENEFSNIYVHSSPYHIRSLLYLLQIEKELPVTEINVENLDRKGLYFLLREADKFKNKVKLPKDLKDKFEIVEEIDFGTVILIELDLKNKDNFVEKNRLNNNGYEVSVNRCFMLELGIEERAKCSLRDLKFIFK